MPESVITNEELQQLLTSLTETKNSYDRLTAEFDEKLAAAKKDATAETTGLISEAAEKAAKAYEHYKALDSKFTEFVQKSERTLITQKINKAETAGSILTKSDKYEDYVSKGKSGAFKVNVKAITNITGAALLDPDISPSLVSQPEPPLMVRDLLPKTTTQHDSVKFVFEKLVTNNAASVAQNTKKPTTNFEFDTKTLNVVTIAHLTKISLQMLDDVPWLENYINGRLAYLLKDAEDLQLLYGDVASGQLEGIMTIATPYDAAMLAALETTDPTRIDELLAASSYASITGKYPASAYVLYPMDWSKLLAVKDKTGRYILGNPDTEAVARLWDLPVVRSFNMTEGKFLTGAFNIASELADRQDANIMIATENVDDFEKNMSTMRAEERVVNLNYRPACYVGGAFTI